MIGVYWLVPGIAMLAQTDQNSSGTQNAVSVWISGDLTVTPGSTIEVPIMIGDISSFDITSYEFGLTYNPDIVTAVGTANGGTISAGYLIVTNLENPGYIRVVSAGANPLTGSGTLILLKFVASSTTLGTTDLSFDSLIFNEGQPEAQTTSGMLSIIGSRQIKVTFQVNTSQIFPALKTGEKTALRGDVLPLDWNQDMILSDPDQDQVYTATVMFDTLKSDTVLDFRYILLREGGQIVWEDNPGIGLNGSRTLILAIGDTVLPIVSFKSPPVSSISEPLAINPSLGLPSNFPNPFNGQTQIRFSLQHPAYSRLSIFNASGQLIQALLDQWIESGEYTITWKPENLPSGIYICYLQCGSELMTHKMVLIK